MILAIRTDAPSVELIILAIDGTLIEHEKWLAERRLALEMLGRLEQLLDRHSLSWKDLTGLIAFEGPGSFTGLRIGLTVLNTIAYSQTIPIVASRGDHWLNDGYERLRKQKDDRMVLPEYGAPARITQPRK